MTAINTADNLLDEIISDEVTAARGQGIDIKAVNASPGFAGHEICDTAAPWLNGFILNRLAPSPYSFHSNALGQWEFATLFEASL